MRLNVLGSVRTANLEEPGSAGIAIILSRLHTMICMLQSDHAGFIMKPA